MEVYFQRMPELHFRNFPGLAALGLAVGLILPIAGMAGTALAAGDAAKGEKVFKKCSACHQIGDGAENGIGPNLTGVIGRTAGTYEGFNYGKYTKKAGEKGLVWTEEQIFEYLRSPKKFLRAFLDDKKAKSKMKFKLKKEDQRNDVIAYLATFSKKAERMINSANRICVTNASDAEHLFVVESKEGDRKVQTLNSTETLCIASEVGKGTIGVFENADALEGCSRLAIGGETQELISYTAFDNCEWAG